MIRLLALLVSTLGLAFAARAAVITAAYTPLGGDHWSVQFVAINDGTPSTISGFTIYFPETEFTALTLNSNPATWDTLVVQPDLGIPAAGFLDSLALLPGDELSLGQSIGGFEVAFTFLGQGAPGSLAFDIVDRSFQVLFSGRTTAPGVNGVPEPTTPLLLVVAAAMAIRIATATRGSAVAGNRAA